MFLLAGALVVLLDQLSRSRTYQVLGDPVSRVETTEKVVALTLDDGPSKLHLDEVLKILGDRDVKATFFLIGAEATEFPEGLRRIREAGHEVGNHSYSHRRMIFVTPSWVQDELDRTEQILRQPERPELLYFRPPYGRKLLVLPYCLWRSGRTTIMWDVEPESKREIEKDADRIVENVLTTTRPGSIILLHVMYDTREPTRRALPRILDGLKERGFRFATVSELLRLRSG
jgi:chitin deacetylase